MADSLSDVPSATRSASPPLDGILTKLENETLTEHADRCFGLLKDAGYIPRMAPKAASLSSIKVALTFLSGRHQTLKDAHTAVHGSASRFSHRARIETRVHQLQRLQSNAHNSHPGVICADLVGHNRVVAMYLQTFGAQARPHSPYLSAESVDALERQMSSRTLLQLYYDQLDQHMLPRELARFKYNLHGQCNLHGLRMADLPKLLSQQCVEQVGFRPTTFGSKWSVRLEHCSPHPSLALYPPPTPSL